MENIEMTDAKAEAWAEIVTSCVTHMKTAHDRPIEKTLDLYKQVQLQLMPKIGEANNGCPMQAFILIDAIMLSVTSGIQCMSLDADENLAMALVTYDSMVSKHRQSLINTWDEAEQQFANDALIAEPKGNA